VDQIFQAFWDTIYADLTDESLPEDPEASDALYERLSSLKVPHVQGDSDSPIALSVGGKRFQLDDNPSAYRAVAVGFGPDY
ncbi:hypothetical protein ACMYLY_23995, partial [Salmonella enterica subsp. enterica serovar Enteritidis]|uniref:hypothetical protein n=1 Tax=Salmonella enterica TaxID=28901 RepID=UPI0039E98A44